jgi:hypothetical protein
VVAVECECVVLKDALGYWPVFLRDLVGRNGEVASRSQSLNSPVSATSERLRENKLTLAPQRFDRFAAVPAPQHPR